MKAFTLGIFRRSPAAYELYAENNPELTRIKVAEHYVRNKGMVDFYRHTTKTAMTAAILVMVATIWCRRMRPLKRYAWLITAIIIFTWMTLSGMDSHSQKSPLTAWHLRIP